MDRGPSPGEYPAEQLVVLMRQIIAEALGDPRAETYEGHAFQRARPAFGGDGPGEVGQVAFGLVGWILGGQASRQRLMMAEELMNAEASDRRHARLFEVIGRLDAGEISWDEFAAVT